MGTFAGRAWCGAVLVGTGISWVLGCGSSSDLGASVDAGTTTGTTTGTATGTTTGTITGSSTGTATGTLIVTVEAIPMPADGWVDRSSNSWGIQGAWYWYSDATTGGKTVITSPPPSTMPLTPDMGMCIRGSTPGGAADNYLTRGAAIGIHLNQPARTSEPLPLYPAPPCYTITVSATSTLGGLRGKLVGQTLAGHEAPGLDLVQGANRMCVNDVAAPSWCGVGSPICDDPSTLANGITAVEVELHAGASGGPIELCVHGIVPSYP